MTALTAQGPFSLKAAAEFGFGPTEGRRPPFDGTMRLAFAVDGGRGYAGAMLRQETADGPVSVELDTTSGADAGAALRQVARIVSLDHDGDEFLRAGERDPVLGGAPARTPRPAARPVPQPVRGGRVGDHLGPAALAPGGSRTRRDRRRAWRQLSSSPDARCSRFPQPDRLLELPDVVAGLNPEKIGRLRGLATAALGGELDISHLHALGPERAYEHVQRLSGIGPFYATLIVVRGSGFADALLQVPEPRLMKRVAQLYGLAAPPAIEQFTAIAEPWRPFRTWATVLIRLAGDRAAR